jgi:hypothetical protein
VILFADADAQRFVSRLVRRGIERRCLRPFHWEAIRDPMRDARVAQQPLAAAEPFRADPETRFLVLWDHEGSGREDRPPPEVEESVVAAFERAGVARSRVRAVAFEPEFEIVLAPAWDRVLAELASKRAELPKALAFDRRDPKGSMKDAADEHRLRADPALYEDLASKLSLRSLKQGDALRRVGACLIEWFGSDG